MYHDLKMNTNLANVRLHHLSSWWRCNVNEMEASEVIIADVQFLVMIMVMSGDMYRAKTEDTIS